MIIQVFGTNKCRETQKTIRFFKERSIEFQFIDLTEKSISKGELNDICKYVPQEELINKGSNEFKRLNLQYIQYNSQEILLMNPLVIKTPIIRSKGFAMVGFDEKILKDIIKSHL